MRYQVLSTLERELNKWLEIGECWNDRESAEIENQILTPLSGRTRRLQDQADEIGDFISRIELEIEDIEQSCDRRTDNGSR